MQKREICWIVALLLVIGVYIHYFSHWGEKKEIQINASIRPSPRRGGKATTLPVFFTFDNFYKFTSVKVVEVDGDATNGAGHTVWHLVSKAGSEPFKYFQYGQAVQGMEPDLKGVRAEPLVPGEKYRMEVTAGALKGTSKIFTTQAVPK